MSSREGWIEWAKSYPVEKLADALINSIQGARSRCQYCGEVIECDILEGGGVPDWKTPDGDYGCSDSPDTTDEGCGGHLPVGVTFTQ